MKDDDLISNCVSWYNSMKTIRHSLLIIFCKPTVTESYTPVEPPSDVSIY